MGNQKKPSLWGRFKRAAQDAGEVLQDDLEAVNGEIEKVKKTGAELLSEAEEVARSAARKGGEIYRDLELEERTTGAAMGAKVGLVLGARGGPVGMKFGLAAGAATGLVVGPTAVKKFLAWRDKSNDDKPESSPEAESADNDNTPKPEGP